jgi:hypothetical protein
MTKLRLTRKNIKRIKSRKTKRCTHMKGGTYPRRAQLKNFVLFDGIDGSVTDPTILILYPEILKKRIVIEDLGGVIDDELFKNLFQLIIYLDTKIYEETHPDSEEVYKKIDGCKKEIKKNLELALKMLNDYYTYLKSKQGFFYISELRDKRELKIKNLKPIFLIFLEALNFFLHMRLVVHHNEHNYFSISTNMMKNTNNSSTVLSVEYRELTSYKIIIDLNISEDMKYHRHVEGKIRTDNTNIRIHTKAKERIVGILNKLLDESDRTDAIGIFIVNIYLSKCPIPVFKLLLEEQLYLCLEFLTLPLQPNVELNDNDTANIDKFITNAEKIDRNGEILKLLIKAAKDKKKPILSINNE